jgi:aspartyl-tRNA(Asn)/glutamyl-tRNA(Gln) amidotransferase subunit A
MSVSWLSESTTNLGNLISVGKIDPIELTECYLDAIESHAFKDRIYSTVTFDRARTEAKAASERMKSGMRRSHLDGVPISWKDLFDTAGILTEAGTGLLKGRIPQSDAEVVKNATEAGLICLGKTHMSELAFSGLGLNPVTQSPPCINNFDAVAGGSSSGAAASVAFNLASCGIGSDTGGSVRVPSAWNDLVGLKTTAGRLSLQGVVPLSESFDTVGPLCRTVSDANLMLSALEGSKAADLSQSSLDGVKILIIENVVMDNLCSDSQNSFNNIIDILKAKGTEIDYKSFSEVEGAMSLGGTLVTTEAYGTWFEHIEKTPEVMFSQILKRFRLGKATSGAEYVDKWRKLKMLRQSFFEKIRSYDFILMPASAILPPNMERLIKDEQYFDTQNLLALRNTRLCNFLGTCALTLPTSIPSCGIMLVGLPNTEAQLLRNGIALEEVLSA